MTDVLLVEKFYLNVTPLASHRLANLNQRHLRSTVNTFWGNMKKKVVNENSFVANMHLHLRNTTAVYISDTNCVSRNSISETTNSFPVCRFISKMADIFTSAKQLYWPTEVLVLTSTGLR